MAYYAARAGSQVAFDRDVILRSVVGSAYPYMEDGEVNALIESAKEKMRNFSDREKVKELYRRSGPSVGDNKLEELMDKVEGALKDPEKEKGLVIRFVIAEIVGRSYGEEEKIKYIRAVILGQAV